MKTLLLLAVPLALVCGAEKKTAAKPAVTQPAAKQAATLLPKEAVLVAPYTYKYTDSAGNKWLYRQTPFGLVKMEDKPAPAVIENVDANPTVATDLGESVKFERKTPFGMQNWTKKKTDLTDEEKAVVARSTPGKQ